MEFLSYFIWSAGPFTCSERDHAGFTGQASPGSHSYFVKARSVPCGLYKAA